MKQNFVDAQLVYCYSSPQDMYLRMPVVTSAMVIAFTGIFALVYPPQLLRVSQSYVGGPVGDKDLELRLEASDKFGYLAIDKDAWNSTSKGCGFRFNFNTQASVVGREVGLEDVAILCLQDKALDLYAVQGVEISTTYEDPSADNDTSHCVEENGYELCWYRFSDVPLIRHSINLGEVNFETMGISSESVATLATWEVEGMLDIADIRGPYALANMYKVCTESLLGGFSCTVVFDLWRNAFDPVVVEPSSASAGKILAAAKLDSLVRNGDVLEDESFDASRSICDSFEGNKVTCDIDCTIHYPYSSSLCAGSVEIRELGHLPHSVWIAVVSLFLVVAVLLAEPVKGPFMGYCRPRQDENPMPQRGNSYSGGGQANPTRPIVAEGRQENAVIPLRSWPGCAALLKRDGVGGTIRVGDDSVILAFCISVEGTVRNATVKEAMEMLEPAEHKEFAAASKNRNTIEWASAFSLYHCISCVWMYGVLTHIAVTSGWGAFYWLLALFTYTCFNQETSLGTAVRACRFHGKVLPYSTQGEDVVLPTLLGAAQLWYDLELPCDWILSWGIFVLVVVAVISNVILVSCVYSGLPTADNIQDIPGASWSVEDAIKLCRSSGSRFGMAGDWVERSRCGDIAGRTALMTSLGWVENRGEKLGHVYKRSQTSWAVGKEDEHGREEVMVCAGFEG